MKILITGGHLTPALGYIDYVKEHDSKVQLIFAGRKFSQKNQLSHEKAEVSKRGLPFINYNAPRLSSSNPFKVALYGFQFLNSVIHALILLVWQQPNLFLSFGGYLAVPMSIASSLLGIPIITHEQTVVAGQANTLIGKVAQIIAVSHKESLPYFPKEKTIVTGIPFRASVLNPKNSSVTPSWLPIKVTQPVLYVTGGNQGSLILNQTVQHILPQLTKKFFVIHACGNPSSQGNYLQELLRTSKKLSLTQQKNYVVQPWFSDEEISWIYQHCTVAISRAGANTVAELTLFAIPTIYIPLPFAKNNEQELNIKSLIEHNASILIPQTKLTASELLTQLENINKKQASFKARLKSFLPSKDGAKNIHELVRRSA